MTIMQSSGSVFTCPRSISSALWPSVQPSLLQTSMSMPLREVASLTTLSRLNLLTRQPLKQALPMHIRAAVSDRFFSLQHLNTSALPSRRSQKGEEYSGEILEAPATIFPSPEPELPRPAVRDPVLRGPIKEWYLMQEKHLNGLLLQAQELGMVDSAPEALGGTVLVPDVPAEISSNRQPQTPHTTDTPSYSSNGSFPQPMPPAPLNRTLHGAPHDGPAHAHASSAGRSAGAAAEAATSHGVSHGSPHDAWSTPRPWRATSDAVSHGMVPSDGPYRRSSGALPRMLGLEGDRGPEGGGNAADPSWLSRTKTDPQSAAAGMAPGGFPAGAGSWLDGNVHRVTFRNKSNGYSVLSIEVEDASGPLPDDACQKIQGGKRSRGRVGDTSFVKVVGTFPHVEPGPGQRFRFHGSWVYHKEHKRQFQAARLDHLEATEGEAMVKYLVGQLNGVGLVTARSLVDHFGGNLVKVLDGDDAAKRLLKVRGIGRVKASDIKAEWDLKQGATQGRDFLKNMGISRPLIDAIVNEHGSAVESKLTADPYAALEVIEEANFADAENVALFLRANLDQGGAHGSSSTGLIGKSAAAWATSQDQTTIDGLGGMARAALAMRKVLGDHTASCSNTWVSWSQLCSETLCLLHGLKSSGYQKTPFQAPLQDLAALQPVAERLIAQKHLLVDVLGPDPPRPAAATAEAYGNAAAAAERNQTLPQQKAPSLQPRLGASFISRPSTDGISRPGTDDISRGGTDEISSGGTDEISRPGTDEISRPGTDEISRGGTNEIRGSSAKDWWPPSTRCYPSALKQAEESLVAAVSKRMAQIPTWQEDVQKGRDKVWSWLDKREQKSGDKLSRGQREALLLSITAPLVVVTGGPGCGKTFWTRDGVKLWRACQMKCLLAAPTGRAAQRLQEETGEEAMTIHRMLGSRGDLKEEVFLHGPGNPLDVNVLVIDEASMLDLPLAAALFEALPSSRALHVVLIGDVDQLKPVGPGSVLSALIGCGRVPVLNLQELFRQSLESGIVACANDVLCGRFPSSLRRLPLGVVGGGGGGQPVLAPSMKGAGEAFWLEVNQWASGRDQMDSLLAVISNLLQPMGLDLTFHVQILSPMRKGEFLGTQNLNVHLQQRLNPGTRPQMELRLDNGQVLRVGDRVMQLENNSELDVYNGDWGTVEAVNPAQRTLVVHFKGGKDGRRVTYEGTATGQVELAWATTVHKAQGGEAEVVILLLSPQHGRMLCRPIFYTGVTRARQLLVVVGSRGALEKALQDQQEDRRCSLLDQLLRSEALSSLPAVSPLVFRKP
eukprot:jgi/Botrbrau1/15543/Bobra.0333s0009.2